MPTSRHRYVWCLAPQPSPSGTPSDIMATAGLRALWATHSRPAHQEDKAGR